MASRWLETGYAAPPLLRLWKLKDTASMLEMLAAGQMYAPIQLPTLDTAGTGIQPSVGPRPEGEAPK
eukprot:7385531-Prymnesium_polylepis.2